MNKKFTRIITVITFVMLAAVAACTAQTSAQSSGGATQVSAQAQRRPSATPQPFPTRRPSVTPTATALPNNLTAESVAKDYFAALQSGDFAKASQYVSTISQNAFGLTQGDIATMLATAKSSGMSWSNLTIKGSQAFDSQTVLVHVTYQGGPGGKQLVDEFWPMRNELGQWVYNWNNLIDFRYLYVADQTMGGVTMRPLVVMRYSDRIDLNLVIQNRTNDPVVFGQVNEDLAVFNFQGQEKTAEKSQIILNPHTSYTNQIISVKGLFTTFPDSVVIRKWKSLNVKPWYTFLLTD